MSRVRYCPTCEVAWADGDGLVCWLCGRPDGRSKWLMLSQSCRAPDPLRVAREEAR